MLSMDKDISRPANDDSAKVQTNANPLPRPPSSGGTRGRPVEVIYEESRSIRGRVSI